MLQITLENISEKAIKIQELYAVIVYCLIVNIKSDIQTKSREILEFTFDKTSLSNLLCRTDLYDVKEQNDLERHN